MDGNQRTRTADRARPLAASAPDGAALRRALLGWFRREQRTLPWRADRDPYRVWISEAMLQQTRVATVIPYYERFLARFPDVRALAEAPLDDVLAHWSGLGYYRRARMLQQAAQTIVAQHAGQFPATTAELLLLPGIGRYTAGAIASIAFDAREPLVDGNVARVFARLFALDGDPASKQFQDELWSRAAVLLPRSKGAGEWNQALMELGALVCTPREPRCCDCPLAKRCRALAEGRVAELPALAARRTAIDVDLLVLLVPARGRWLVERRPAQGRMASLWQFPTIERATNAVSGARLFPTQWPKSVAKDGRRVPLLTETSAEALTRLRHTITHHRIRAEVRWGSAQSDELPEDWRWSSPAELGRLALTGMARKVFTRVLAAPTPRMEA